QKGLDQLRGGRLAERGGMIIGPSWRQLDWLVADEVLLGGGNSPIGSVRIGCHSKGAQQISMWTAQRSGPGLGEELLKERAMRLQLCRKVLQFLDSRFSQDCWQDVGRQLHIVRKKS